MKEGIAISKLPSTYSFLKVFTPCNWGKEVLAKRILVLNEFFPKFALNHGDANVTTAHVIAMLNSKRVEELGGVKSGPKQGSLFLPSQSFLSVCSIQAIV